MPSNFIHRSFCDFSSVVCSPDFSSVLPIWVGLISLLGSLCNVNRTVWVSWHFKNIHIMLEVQTSPHADWVKSSRTVVFILDVHQKSPLVHIPEILLCCLTLGILREKDLKKRLGTLEFTKLEGFLVLQMLVWASPECDWKGWEWCLCKIWKMNKAYSV